VRAASAKVKNFIVETWDLRKRVGLYGLIDDDASGDGVIGKEVC
jgi:hypothetical protein